MKTTRPTHYYDRAAGRGGPAVISCGAAVIDNFSPNWENVSCYSCARNAVGLTDAQRNHVWQNANERLGKEKRTPWPVADVDARAKKKRKRGNR